MSREAHANQRIGSPDQTRGKRAAVQKMIKLQDANGRAEPVDSSPGHPSYHHSGAAANAR